jgi:hypothetical protein
MVQEEVVLITIPRKMLLMVVCQLHKVMEIQDKVGPRTGISILADRME